MVIGDVLVIRKRLREKQKYFFPLTLKLLNPKAMKLYLYF